MGLSDFFDRLTISDRVTMQDAAADPTANGEIRRNGTDVKVQTGGNVKNLNDVGSGGVSTKATATGQEGLYTFEATTGGDHVFAGTDAAFAERRTKTFAADGVRGVEDRTSVGGGFTNTLGPNETSYVYLWQRDLSTVTGGTSSPSSGPRGIVWDGSRFIHADVAAEYLYELDADLAVTGGAAAPAGRPIGMTWDGTRFINVDITADYLYELDADLAVTGGTQAPASGPQGIAWDGGKFLQTGNDARYHYELGTDLAVTGGKGTPNRLFTGSVWDGSRFIVAVDGGVDEFYEYDEELAFVSGTPTPDFAPVGVAWDGTRFVHSDTSAAYLYEYSGSFDFTAGIIS